MAARRYDWLSRNLCHTPMCSVHVFVGPLLLLFSIIILDFSPGHRHNRGFYIHTLTRSAKQRLALMCVAHSLSA